MPDDATPAQQLAILENAYEQLLEFVEESVTATTSGALVGEDRGWIALANGGGTLFPMTERLRAMRLARVMAIADPLIRRAVNLRTAYVWGQGVSVSAPQEEGAEQDLNAVVQAFLDDPSNQSTFSSSQARTELERRFATDGECFHALFTSPLTGRVQVRIIVADEITDIITNPEDSADPWFYKREWTGRTVVAVGDTTKTDTQRKVALYPAVGFRPQRRPRTIDGHDVMWDAPVLHTAVNSPEGQLRGTGDAYASLPWALGYKEFLEDWAKLVKALSRLAFKTTSKGRNAPALRAAISTGPADGSSPVGGTLNLAEGQSIEAIGKSGATIDSESGRPLAAMVGSGMDVPVTMLLADPGVTGARATAETLDKPLELIMSLRQDLNASLIRTVLGYVVDQAVKAPRGPLKGKVGRDETTGREVVTLKGDQDRTIVVDFPSLAQTPLETLIKAIVEADSTQKLPPLTVARMLLVALGVDDVDTVLEDLVDANGDFVYPEDAAAAGRQQDAVALGNQPGTPAANQDDQQPPPPPPPATSGSRGR